MTNIPTLILPPLLMTALASRKVFTGPRKVLFENVAQLTASAFFSPLSLSERAYGLS